jgi:lipoprotein-releasing system permease protein
MFRPVPLYVGLRYTRAKRRNHFISFISLVSMLGIALGVAVLITVLSVMNGFDFEIRDRIFGMAQQVAISNYQQQIPNWQKLQAKVAQFPNVTGVAPFVNGQAMLANMGSARPVLLTGVLPHEESKVSHMETKMVLGSFTDLKPGKFGILLGQELADSLGLVVGDKVTVLTTDVTVSPLGVMPQYKRFTVVGIFHVGGGFHIDEGAAFIEMHDAQKLFKLQQDISGLRLKVTDLYAAPQVTEQLQKILPNYLVGNWTQQYGPFFKAIKMEKTMMFIILLLIIAVAAFNLVATLVMVVTDKRSEIAILRTLGASPRTIMAIFMVQGSIIGVVGTLLGVVGGILLALNAPDLVAGLQKLLHMEFISSSVYFIDYLPSRLEWKDVWQISVVALLMSLVATLYPAWQASRTQPAEALRYE